MMTPNKDAIEKAIEALEYYADKDNWEYTVTDEDDPFIRFAPASTREGGFSKAEDALQLLREHQSKQAEGDFMFIGHALEDIKSGQAVAIDPATGKLKLAQEMDDDE